MDQSIWSVTSAIPQLLSAITEILFWLGFRVQVLIRMWISSYSLLKTITLFLAFCWKTLSFISFQMCHTAPLSTNLASIVALYFPLNLSLINEHSSSKEPDWASSPSFSLHKGQMWSNVSREWTWKEEMVSCFLSCQTEEANVPQPPAERLSIDDDMIESQLQILLAANMIAVFNELQFFLWELLPWSQCLWGLLPWSQTVCEDCEHGRSVFVRITTMVAVLIRLKISEFF